MGVFVFLELPNCSRALTPAGTTLDKFCFALHNMWRLQEKPAGMEGERASRKEGMEKGVEQGQHQALKRVACNMLKRNIPVDEIAHITGLSEAEVRDLQRP